jgi:hypothetical protein
VKTVFGNLFPEGTDKLTDREKAFRIYKYIEGNIHYSSVSFRQGAYIPQKASVTIDTRLGDCKDLSSLFVSLARLSGLKADLVLVNTRDNGLKSMELPSLEFNHCIVKTWIDGKAYFLELTDNNLPFASLPTSLMHATCLVIPTGEAATAGDTAVTGNVTAAGNAKLEFVESPLRPRDKSSRRIDLHVEGSNLKMGVDVCRTGALVSSIRDDFAELSTEKRLEKMQDMVSGDFKNAVKVDSVSFKGLKESGDSAGYSYHATVDNEVVEVGEMHMIKIPFTDVIATVDDFSKDDRQFPVEYWRYENADEYDTRITIEAPVGRHFIELPKSETYTFRNSTYSLQYIPSGTRKLTIIRKVTLQRDDVMPAEYKAMKEFFGKIVKAESKYIVYK